jgi:hypothetical protein
MEDQELICREPGCGEKFIHSVKEQEWMRNKWGEDYRAPTRCLSCRKKRRELKNGDQ